MNAKGQLPRRECSRLLDLTADLYCAPTAQAIAPALLGRLPAMIPCEFAGCHLMDARGGPMQLCYSPQRSTYPGYNRDFWKLVESHPLTTRVRRLQPRAWQITDVVSIEKFRRTEFYNVLYRPLGIDHELVAMTSINGGPNHVVILSLHRQRRGFSERERAVLNLAIPHLIRAYRQRRDARSSRPVVVARQAEDPQAFAELVRAKTAWRLSEREIEVLFWLGQGKSNSEIGAVLGISARTAETHTLNVYPKIGVENRYSAIAEVRELIAHGA